MNFKTVESVDAVVWDMKMADWPRATNRAEINRLFNGNPPYTAEEQTQNNIYSNFNDLTATRIASAARGQFLNALVTPDPLVNIELDYGPAWKKNEWASRISNAINLNLKNSLPWMEEEESTFAQLVLHGIGPAYWPTQELWCPIAKGIEDVLMPGNTLRDFRNLQFFAVYEQYTAAELYRLTSGPKVDSGWNMELVDYLIKWQIQQARGLMANAWPQTWSPERNVEILKEDAGIVGFDTMPTIDTWHFYFWSDDGRNSGWRKRVILDSWGNPGQAYSSMGANNKMPDKKKYGDTSGIKSQFLFDPGARKYANKREELISFQFGDASAVAPFRYHACRGLGFMLYSVCQIENRLKCKLADAAFESLMQYFRVSDPADQERLTKLDLINFGVIPEGVNFMPQEQRWQTNLPVAETSLNIMHDAISENSASFTQDFDLNDNSKEETATRTMAKVNSTAQLVNAMIGRGYNYQKFKLQEVCRRHCIEDSRDPDVRRFRVEMLKAGVPKEALNIERWTVQPVRTIGNGNAMIQVAMMDKVMATAYPRLGPEAQNDMMRRFLAVNTGDYDLANSAVPMTPPVSNTVHDSELASGRLLQGGQVSVRDGQNHDEVIQTMLKALTNQIALIKSTANIPDALQLAGLGNLAAHIEQQIQMLAQDPTAKPKVQIYQNAMMKIGNTIKAFGQQLQEQQQAQAAQQADGGIPPEDKARLAMDVASQRAKLTFAKEKHAQATAQKQIAFEQKLHQQEQEHQVERVHKVIDAVVKVKAAKAAPKPAAKPKA